jgi:Tetratricopeptide repeat
LGDAYINLAAFYFYQGDYPQCILYTRKSFSFPSSYFQQQELLYGFLGEAFFKLNQLDSALFYIQKAYQLDIASKDWRWSVPYYILGGIHAKLNHPELALNYYRLGISIKAAQKDIIDGYLGIANVFEQVNIRDSALYYAKKVIEEGRQFSFLPEVLEATVLVKNIYKKENKDDSTFFYQELMIQVKDSLFSQEKQRLVQNLTFDEQLRQQELELDKIKKTEERKQNIQYVIIALGLVIFVILFFLFSHSIVANERLIKFLGILSLLIVFEFINLLIHPYLADITSHSVLLMLVIMVCIAALLIPLHHRLEKLVTLRMVEKNKKIRLASAKKTIAKLQDNSN